MKEVQLVLRPSEVLEKSMHEEHEALQKGRALPDGTVRSWGGKDYVKKAGKWVPKPVEGKKNIETDVAHEAVSKHGKTKKDEGNGGSKLPKGYELKAHKDQFTGRTTYSAHDPEGKHIGLTTGYKGNEKVPKKAIHDLEGSKHWTKADATKAIKLHAKGQTISAEEHRKALRSLADRSSED